MRLNRLAVCSRSRNILLCQSTNVQYGTNSSLPLDSVLLKLVHSVASDHIYFKIRFARRITPLCIPMLHIGTNMVGPGSVGGIAIR